MVFDSTKTSYENMLNVFWETHDPTTLNRQGNDVGSQYRTQLHFFIISCLRMCSQHGMNTDEDIWQYSDNSDFFFCFEIKGSAIYYYSDEQKRLAEATRDHFNDILKTENRPTCTTEIKPISEYYLAEEYRTSFKLSFFAH